MSINKIAEGWTHSAPAAVSLLGKENYLARIDSTGKIALANSSTPTLGPIHEAPDIGGEATVYFGSIGKAISGANINAGSAIASDDNGKAVTATSGKWVVGIALNSVAQGELVSYACVSSQA